MTRIHPRPTAWSTAAPSVASASPNGDGDGETRIDADLLIPGRGGPIKNGSLVFSAKKGKIVYAGSTENLPFRLSNLAVSTRVPVLMPGMWDCHVHFFGMLSLNLDAIALDRQALAGFRSAFDVASTLNAGFTSVREVGGYGIDFSKAIDDGTIPGPHVYSAGAPISQTAGHGDLHTMPLELCHDRIKHGLPLALADGVDEAIKAVRLQIRRGASLIKVCSTGGVLSLIDSPQAAEFTNAELKAMVDEATRTNMIVAAHAHGTDGIIAALNAGVKTIEHGSYLTKEAIDLMIEKGAMLVATRTIVATGVKYREGMSDESYKKILEIEKAHLESYKAAIKAGVKCALGTDLGISVPGSHLQHGLNGQEFGFAVQAGMSPLQAIECGTANSPLTLGPRAPLSGQLKQDYDADFIAIDRDPLENIGVLAKPECITHVWKGGKLMKAPGKPVGFL